MECYEHNSKGMSIQHIKKHKTEIGQWIEGFLDDTSIFCNNNDDQKNFTKLLEILQHDAQLWTNLLATTSGKLELQKCFYYVLAWKFDDEGFGVPLKSQELVEKYGQIQVTNNINHEMNVINQKCFSETHPIATETDQYKYLQHKSETPFTSKLAKAKLTPNTG